MTHPLPASATPIPAAAPDAPSPPSSAPPPPVPALDDPALRETALFDRARQGAFLAALAECGSARGAAKACGIGHQTAYRQRRACAVFRRAWDAALLAARVHAEEVLASRALDGVEEEVWYHGEVIATRRRYDSRLLLAHLARLDRLTANAEASAFAEDFEAARGRFEEGSDTPEIDPAAECCEKDPGQWSTRSTLPAKAPDPAPPPGWEWCPHEEKFLPYVDRMLNAMDAGRPPGAATPRELYCGHSASDIEAEQMAAFEAGVERWWLVVPPGDIEPDEDGLCYWEEE